MSTWRVDQPTEPQLRNVAELRYAWVVGHGHEALDDESTFVSRFVAWMQQHAETHRCRVVVHTDGTGIGRLLIDALVALARTIGAEHVTVHPGAVSAYRRAGFATDPLMLFQDTREPERYRSQ